MGKTTALRAYTSHCEPRALILDPHSDFGGVMRAESLDEALDELAAGDPCRRRLVYRPRTGEGLRFGEEFFARCYEELERCLIVIDEVTLWTKPHGSDALRDLILQGRHAGLRLAISCQKVGLVPYEMLSEMTELVAFRMARPRDLEVIDEWAGDALDASGDEVSASEVVRALAPWHCLAVEL